MLQPVVLPPLRETPLVSVLIACYNHAPYVGAAIESALKQTYGRLEVVVCDDGSSDGSHAVVQHWAERDTRVRFTRQQNGGQSSALNTAFANATGAILALLDSDDLWEAHRLERVVDAFRANPQAGGVMHRLVVIDTASRVLKPVHPPSLSQGWLAPAILDSDRAVRPSLPPASGISLRREVADLVFPLSSSLRSIADCALSHRVALVTNVATVAEILGSYRQHEANITGAAGPTTEARITATLSQLTQLLEDRRQFLATLQVTEYSVGAALIAEGREFLLARALVQNTPGCDVKLLLNGTFHRGRLWRLLFHLPRPAALRFFRWWWGSQGRAKRLVRLVEAFRAAN
jgi:hypothetical protein